MPNHTSGPAVFSTRLLHSKEDYPSRGAMSHDGQRARHVTGTLDAPLSHTWRLSAKAKGCRANRATPVSMPASE